MRCWEFDVFKIRNLLSNCLDFFFDFFGVFMGECFGFFLDFLMGIFLGGFFQRIFLEGILCLYSQSQLTYLNLKGIDAFVKILSQ